MGSNNSPLPKPPQISRTIRDYNMALSQVKIKSFYTCHLCQKNCLEGKLNTDTNKCINDCSHWLEQFYKFKKEHAPSQQQKILSEIEDIYIKEGKIQDLGKREPYMKAQAELKKYLEVLENQLDKKIQLEKKGKK